LEDEYLTVSLDFWADLFPFTRENSCSRRYV